MLAGTGERKKGGGGSRTKKHEIEGERNAVSPAALGVS